MDLQVYKELQALKVREYYCLFYFNANIIPFVITGAAGENGQPGAPGIGSRGPPGRPGPNGER